MNNPKSTPKGVHTGTSSKNATLLASCDRQASRSIRQGLSAGSQEGIGRWRKVPANRDPLGAPSKAPALRGPLLPPDVHLEDLEGQLAGNSHKDSQTQLLTAMSCHSMRYLMTNLLQTHQLSAHTGAG